MIEAEADVEMEVKEEEEKETKKKKTLGRRKIQIKKVQNQKARYVHFSKRRATLFRKASDLSTICGADVAIAAQSCGGKLFTFGDFDRVAARYLDYINATAGGAGTVQQPQHQQQQQQQHHHHHHHHHHQQRDGGGGFWWEKLNVEGKSMEELKELASRLAAEKEHLARRVAGFIFPADDINLVFT